MCGRYSLSSSAQLVRETFDLDGELELSPRWNIAPTQDAPVVRRASSGARRLDLMRWGLVPPRSTTLSGGQINARSETADGLPAFRDAFRKRRCLVPADGFYEWLALEGQRHPFHIRRRDRRPLAFAGLWSRWQPERAVPVDSFTILTCPPSDVVRPLHDRMPVILSPASWPVWLGDDTEAEALRALLVPWAGDELEAVPVSSAVNRADAEGQQCVREVPRPVARQLSLLG
jgi:putative SOS response-associated peptidase YedK